MFIFYAPILDSSMHNNPCCPMSLPTNDVMLVFHQRGSIAISDNDATRNHQGNSNNLIIGQHESNFDLFRRMIRHSIVRYANVKEWGILIQFLCVFAEDKCTEIALLYFLMNLHRLEIVHIGTVGYVMKTHVYFHSITSKMIEQFDRHYTNLLHL